MQPNYTIKALHRSIEKTKEENGYSQGNNDLYLIKHFKNILANKLIEEKELFLNEAFKELPPQNHKRFEKECLILVSSNNKLVKWFSGYYLSNKTDSEVIQCISLIKSPNTVISLIQNKLSHLSKESFKDVLLHNTYEGLKSMQVGTTERNNRQNALYYHYVSKYVEKSQLFSELKEENKDQTILHLLKKNWFDTYAVNEILYSNLSKMTDESTVLNHVLEFVCVDFLPIYEDKLKSLFKDNKVNGGNFSHAVNQNIKFGSSLSDAVNQKSKFNYIADNLVYYPQQMTKMIDDVLIRAMNTPGQDKNQFNHFINEMLQRHIDKGLTVNQLCIMAKRCSDCYQKESFLKIFKILDEHTPELGIEAKNILYSSKEIQMYDNKIVDLGAAPVRKFLLQTMHDYLKENLSVSTAIQRKPKI